MASGERHRRALIAELRERGSLRTAAVEDAFRTVPRERFLPDTLRVGGLEAVYRDDAIITKRDAQGAPISSSSQPTIMALMLDLLDVQPGHRVLEIGAGTGYNAGLLAHLVGRSGRVTSVDIDPAIARQARRALRDAGLSATIVTGDGRDGRAAGAPFDRIIATASTDHIPRAWLDQLRDGGRLVVPVRIDPERGAIQLILAFERHGGTLRSVGMTRGGFMPMHDGDGGWRPSTARLSAARTVSGSATGLVTLDGAGLGQLSGPSGRTLLAALLGTPRPPHRHGLMTIGPRQPPLLLIYLLLSIPFQRRFLFYEQARQGLGLIDRGSQSTAIVSYRDPWNASRAATARVRWRLDGYGNDAAALALGQLIDQWRVLERSGQTELRVLASGNGDTMRLAFDWGRPG